MTRIAAGAGGLAMLGCCLSGCGAVEVPVPGTGTQVASVCAQLTANLPTQVASLTRRRVRPASPLTAAWGSPPVVLTCGVPAPGAETTTRSQCYQVNGVGWFEHSAPAGTTFTTIGRLVNVEVVIPAKYAPQANVLIDLASPISRFDKQLHPCA